MSTMREPSCILPDEFFVSAESVPDADNTIIWIGEQIRLLERGRRSLYERRNQLLAVSKLPSELLSEVFRHIVSQSPTRFEDGREWEASFPSWICITHVCRAWRAVALNDPCLWTCPSFNRLPLAQQMIKRARGLPIEIQVMNGWNVPSRPGLHELISLAFQKGNVKTVDVAMVNEDLQHIHHHLVSAGESLEHLSVTDMGWRKSRYSTDSAIFIPNVRTLRLKNTSFSVQPQPLHHLTSLSIYIGSRDMCDNLRATSHVVPSLLRILEAAPRLEQVELRNALASHQVAQSADIESSSSPGVVLLPHLRSLSLMELPDLGMELLQQLEMPMLRCLKLSTPESSEISFVEQVGFFGQLRRIVTDCQSHPPNLLEVTWGPHKLQDSIVLSSRAPSGSHIRIQIHEQMQASSYPDFLSQIKGLTSHSLKHISNALLISGSKRLGRVDYNSLPPISVVRVEGHEEAWWRLLNVLRESCVDAGLGLGRLEKQKTFSRVSLITFDDAVVGREFWSELGVVLSRFKDVGYVLPKLRFNRWCAGVGGLVRSIPTVIVEVRQR